jgi:hypothetical protein
MVLPVTVLIIKRPFVIMSSWLNLFLYFFAVMIISLSIFNYRRLCSTWEFELSQADDSVCFELLLSSMDVCVDYVFRPRLTRYSSHYTTGSRWEFSSCVISIHGDVDNGSVASYKQLRDPSNGRKHREVQLLRRRWLLWSDSGCYGRYTNDW